MSPVLDLAALSDYELERLTWLWKTTSVEDKKIVDRALTHEPARRERTHHSAVGRDHVHEPEQGKQEHRVEDLGQHEDRDQGRARDQNDRG